MAFAILDRDSQDAVFVGDLVVIINELNNLHGRLEIANQRMQNMTDAQMQTLYGLATAGQAAALRDAIAAAYTVVNTNADLDAIRTQMG